MSIDLDAVAATFAASRDFTIGIEEEFQILDPGTLDLTPRYEELRAIADEDPVLGQGGVTGELISSEIEVVSGRGEHFADAIAAQRERRRAMFAIAARQGVALGSTGTHPWADYREQSIIDTPHYRRREEGLQYVARRNNTFSLHVHVGIEGLDRAVQICDRMRPVLPVLLAAAGNSPFLEHRDSGLASARTQIFTRTFPRCGIPDHFGGWDAYRDYVELLFETNSIVEFTQIWWSIRPHFSFGTVEVRICDAQTTAGESEAIAALIAGCIAQAARDVDESVPFEPLAPRLIEENLWRAIRYGLEGRMVDFAHRGEIPTQEAVERLVSWSAPARRELGIDLAPPERNGAERQRAALNAGATLEEAFAAAVRETRETYAQEVAA